MKSGIYKITNIYNNNFYIGSSSNINRRIGDHFYALKKNKHCNNKLQNSYNKYSINNFTYEILAQCPKEYLLKLEKWFIDNLKPDFNLATFTNTYTQVMSDQGKENIKKSLISRNYNRGIKKHFDPKKRQKAIEILRKNKSIAISVWIDNIYYKDYNSIKEASIDLYIRSSSIARALKQKGLYLNKYKFTYKYQSIKYKKDKRFIPCDLYTISNNFIKSFETYSHIADYLKIHRTTIERAVKNNKPLLKKYIIKKIKSSVENNN